MVMPSLPSCPPAWATLLIPPHISSIQVPNVALFVARPFTGHAILHPYNAL